MTVRRRGFLKGLFGAAVAAPATVTALPDHWESQVRLAEKAAPAAAPVVPEDYQRQIDWLAKTVAGTRARPPIVRREDDLHYISEDEFRRMVEASRVPHLETQFILHPKVAKALPSGTWSKHELVCQLDEDEFDDSDELAGCIRRTILGDAW